MNYPTEKLGNHIQVLSGFAFKSKDFSDTGIPVIKIKNVTPPSVSLIDLSYVPEEIAGKNRKFVLSYDDVLIALTGSHINQMASVVGRVAKVKYSEKTVLNQRVGKITVNDPDDCDLDFVYYYLSQDKVKIELASKAGGAANQANISPTDIKNLMFPFPNIDVQRKIASVLRAYDDLIENNQKQIKLLEEAAQRLYKEWFVDLRFPGHETTPIVNGVPEGWRKDELKHIALLKAGGDRPKIFSKERTDQCTVPVFSNGTENEGLYGYTDKAEIEDSCVTISARGSVGYTCLRKVGFVPIVRLIAAIPIAIDVEYLFFCLKNMTIDSNGAAQQQITVPMIKNKQIVLPSDDILKMFICEVRPIMNLRENLKLQMEKLIEARDRLLPKLMSGEIEV